MSKNIKGGVVVTGSTKGIGKEIARALVDDGYGVVVTSRNEDECRQTVKDIVTQPHHRASFSKLDVADRDSVRQAINECRDKFGSLEIMINNAGYNKPQPFLKGTEEVWHQVMNTNALGTFLCMQEAAEAMIVDGISGKIINIASIAGRRGFGDFAPYCASKAAVISLTHSGAQALAPHGITVNGVAPGVIDTPMWEQVDDDLYEMGSSSKPGEAMSSLASEILLGRVGHPKDVFGTVKFLCSSASDYMTGQVLVIDGGMLLQ